ncbi:hypothetical protein DNU06_02655 [Putridiphycobacter roseus]|uniref:Uncharacterized protein n=2 Tax=Putridiphycobacter roseus TaxID=2219161 RepID=A0A2W1N348_9FLAO|nr:hypothetical protein DNU06_02655 [Putridiphycobacter roseus]
MYQAEAVDESKIFCEAYEFEQGIVIPSQENNNMSTTAINDLCASCDFKESCTLRSLGHFIFQCEHYE